MKTLTLVALLGFATFSAMAEETPLMTQTQQQEERQTMQSNMYGKKSDVENGTGVKTQTQTRTRTQLQDGSGGGQNMNAGMQGAGTKRGGR